MKTPKKNSNKTSRFIKNQLRLRTHYMDQSRRFVEWVNGLGIEKTIFGKLAQSMDERFGIRKIAAVFLFCLLLSFLLFFDFEFPYFVKVGDIAATDIKSPISFEIVDEVATEAKRREAEKSVPPVFDYDPNIYENILSNVYRSFRSMRTLVRRVNWPKNDLKREEKVKDFLQNKPKFEEDLSVKVPDRIFQWLVEQGFSARLENVLIRALVNWSGRRILEGPSNIIEDKDSPIVIREILRNGEGDEYRAIGGDILNYQKTKEFTLQSIDGVDSLGRKDKRNVLKFARSLIVPNLSFNRQETLGRRQKAREAVLPVQISIKKNQSIVNAGSIVQPVHVTILEEIRNLKSDRRTDFLSLVSAMLFVVLILVFFSYLRRFTMKKIKVEGKDIAVMGVVTFGIVFITKIFLFVTDAAFVAKYGALIPSVVFLYAAPVAAGSMLVGLLITSGEVVWLFSAFLSLVLSIMVDMNFNFFVVSLIGGIAAARGVYNCGKRNDIYWAGLRVGAINMLTITFIFLIKHIDNPDLLNELLWVAPSGLVGGVMSSLVAMMFVPLLESVFNYTTDVKLLELSNLNHPLMQQMIVKAPGTYHHSLVVGSMVEAGAKEIGAKPLLGKVMAYYHDIGKMHHSQYFIENQRRGQNPHDHISPYMSKTILVAHVKDGAEMALKHKLGKPILDGILQHHGTTLISYFYNKALDEQDEDIDHVEEDDFRYPGPKPQFKEAALVMIADSIEAAARSLDEPTSARLQNIVKNIIQAKFLDGQLNECNLTLADLSVIEKAYKRILLGIYHQRIDYPHLNTDRHNPPGTGGVRRGDRRKTSSVS